VNASEGSHLGRGTLPSALSSESDALHARVRAFVDASLEGGAREPFEALALDVAAFQARHVRPVAKLQGGLRPAHVDDVRGLPTDVYRLARVAAHPPEDDVRVFLTSGTTLGARGAHPMRTTQTYEHAALAWGRRMLFPDARAQGGLDVIALADPGDAASSLGFMMSLFARELTGGAREGDARASFHVRASGRAEHGAELDVRAVAEACASARARGRAALVLGASFAFVHLLDGAAGLDLTLPPGSRVMQTGGFKGRSREVEAGALREALARALGVDEALVVSEYGMTELSSQGYEPHLAARLGHVEGPLARRAHRMPPWARVVAVDPATLTPVARGEEGIARVVDLANVDSSLVVQTSDRVRIDDAGVHVLGRLAGATPRGCSLALDELFEQAAAPE
jgi:hypothetical protein